MRIGRRVAVGTVAFVALAAWGVMTAAQTGPLRLLAVSSVAEAGVFSILLETSGDARYRTHQPDGLTLVLELRDVAGRSADNRFSPGADSPVVGVSVDEQHDADGAFTTFVQIALLRPTPYRVSSGDGTVRVEFPRTPDVDPQAGTAGALTSPTTTLDAFAASDVATEITSLETRAVAGGLAVTLRGNGRLMAGYIGPVAGAPPRLMLDFPNLTASVPPVLTPGPGPVERIRVALNSQSPLVTRVVLDLFADAEFDLVPSPDDPRALTVLVREIQSSGPVASLAATTGRSASGGGPLRIDPMSALLVQESDVAVAPERARLGANEPQTPPTASMPLESRPMEAGTMEPMVPVDTAAAPVNEAPRSPAQDPVAVRQLPAVPAPESVIARAEPVAITPLEAVGVDQQADDPVAIEPAVVADEQVRPAPVPSVQPPPAALTLGDPLTPALPEPAPIQSRAVPPLPDPFAPTPPPLPDDTSTAVGAAQAVPAGVGASGAVQRQEPQYTGHLVTLDFQNADLRAVLRTFSEISGLNMVIDPTVEGSVDVALRDVPWDQALDIILRANKLGYSVDGTVVRIVPLTVLAEEEDQRRDLAEKQALAGELQVMTQTLSYARAIDLAQLLTRTILSPRGSAEVDERTNTLILNDLPDMLEKARGLIGTLDRPEPQVEIEARIVQTTRDFARAIGVQWGVNGRMSQELGNTSGLVFPNSGSVSGRTDASQGPPGDRASAFEQTGTAVGLGVEAATTAIGVALGSVNGAFNLDVALSALERSGNGRVLSTPRVSTQNNVQAEVTQGIQIPIQTVANNTVTVTFKDAALTLRVTPQITSANTVIMQITLENASPDFTRQINGIPPIDTQRANTQVQVDDGATTVIGGIFISREQQVTDRTPLLHRIPLLGWLFKREDVRDESRELLIFITPRILK